MIFARFTKELILNNGQVKIEAGTSAVLSYSQKDKTKPPIASFTFMPGRVIGFTENKPSFITAGEVYKLKDQGVEILDDEGAKYEMSLDPSTDAITFYKPRRTLADQADMGSAPQEQQPTTAENQQPAQGQTGNPDEKKYEATDEAKVDKVADAELTQQIKKILDEATEKLQAIGVSFTTSMPGQPTASETISDILKTIQQDDAQDQGTDAAPFESFMSDDLAELPIDNEVSRTYSFFSILPGMTEPKHFEYKIEDPMVLYTREGGTTHRVQDIDGIVHNVPAPGYSGCTVTWEPKPGELAVTA